MIYLDHAATTKPYPEVTEAVRAAMAEDFYNPSSLYRPAKAVEKQEQRAFATLAETLGCEPEELVQTSSATEATNHALKGLFSRYGKRLNRIIATASDHDATLSTLTYLAAHGADVVLLTPGRDGLIDPAKLSSALTDKTLAVSLLLVNNESGVVQDFASLIPLIRERAPKAYVHADLVQAWGKMKVNLHALDVDLASFSAHKIHGPKGVGLLYHKKSVLPDPLIHGGGQQKGFRSGTDNWPLLSGMAVAAAGQDATLAERLEKILKSRTYLEIELQKLGGVVNFPGSVPAIMSVAFPGLKGETLVHMLEEQDIYLSTSSACHAGSKASHVLRACKVPAEQAAGTLRISLDAENSREELETFVKTLSACIEQLKRWASVK